MSMTINRHLLRKTMIAVLVGTMSVCSVSAVNAKPHHRHHATAQPASVGFSFGFGGSIVSIAESQIGNGAIYGRRSLWCGAFMNWVIEKAGYKGTGSNMAASFARIGTRVSGPRVGAIAIMGRRGGGHVGVVVDIDGHGNPIIVSGNHNHRVAKSVYPRGRIYAYVML